MKQKGRVASILFIIKQFKNFACDKNCISVYLRWYFFLSNFNSVTVTWSRSTSQYISLEADIPGEQARENKTEATFGWTKHLVHPIFSSKKNNYFSFETALLRLLETLVIWKITSKLLIWKNTWERAVPWHNYNIIFYLETLEIPIYPI